MHRILIILMLLVALPGCKTDNIVDPPIVEDPEPEEPPPQPEHERPWVRIDSITPAPGTVLERRNHVSYKFSVNFTAFYDQGSDLLGVYIQAYTEAPQISVRQPALLPSLNPTFRGVLPRQQISSTFLADIGTAPYTTPEQPTRLVVRLILGREFSGIIVFIATAEQVYALK